METPVEKLARLSGLLSCGVVELHGVKGAPGYNLLHSPNKGVREAADKVFKDKMAHGERARQAQKELGGRFAHLQDKISRAVGGQGDTHESFEALADPGRNGDGYAAPGLWGKYGAAGVMIRHVDKQGTERFLLLQRGPGVSSRRGMWQLPGGALDSNENAHQGVARETYEELGASRTYLRSLTPVGETVFEHPSGWKYTNIAADAPHRFTPDVDGVETSDADWFTRAEIEEMRDYAEIVPALEQNLDAVLAHFKPPQAD